MTIKRVTFKNRKAHLRFDGANYVGFQVDVRSDGKRRRNTFATKREALDFVDAVKAKRIYSNAGLKVTPRDIPLVSDVFGKRIPHIQNPSEIVRAVRIFDYFSSLLEYDMPVTDVRSSHFQLFINARAKDGMKPETINREINVLSSAFHRAAEMFPVALEDYEPPRIVRPRFKQRRRERIVTESENAKILAYLYKDTGTNHKNRVRIARMWHLAWLLGLRYSEVVRLVKTDYNAKEKTLRVVRWKTGNVTIFDHLPDEACGVLESAIADADSELILSLSGSTPTKFYQILKEAVEQAGMTWGRDGIDSVTFHSLRHSFITRLVQVTDLATAASYSGHSDGSEMIALYSHASPESRKRAMSAMYSSGHNWRDIYDKIRDGKMDFEAFLALVN